MINFKEEKMFDWKLILISVSVCFVLSVVVILLDNLLFHFFKNNLNVSGKINLKNIALSIFVPIILVSIYGVIDTFILNGFGRNHTAINIMASIAFVIIGILFLYFEFNKFAILISILYIPIMFVIIAFWGLIFSMMITGVGP
jgi:hypothetical protein